jgi:hypothetical protein
MPMPGSRPTKPVRGPCRRGQHPAGTISAPCMASPGGEGSVLDQGRGDGGRHHRPSGFRSGGGLDGGAPPARRRRHHPRQAADDRGRLCHPSPVHRSARSTLGRRPLDRGLLQRLRRGHGGRPVLRSWAPIRGLDPLSVRRQRSPGLKPTWGRVSRHGTFELAAFLDHVGPIARSAADAASCSTPSKGTTPSTPPRTARSPGAVPAPWPSRV